MIRLEGITFGYNKHCPVLEGFNLEFKEGGIYGLLGKNGTGKSTLLYLMTGLLTPQKGNITIDGYVPHKRMPEMMREMFIVPEEYNLPNITLAQYVKALKPFYPNFSQDLMQRCLLLFDMSPDVHLGHLSMGQKKKVYISLALATNTRYLLLDEPTNGLDIYAKSSFRKVMIAGMNEQKTILISTHQVHDVERLLDHVTIIDRNRVLLSQPLVEQDESIDLEELFIRTLDNKYTQV
jgi:ABC-2 type transport system ATP-binding protein